MECQYCNNVFINRSSLLNHQRRTKYCLIKQGVTSENFVCEFCNTNFTRKDTLQQHYRICKANSEYIRNTIKELDEAKLEINKLKSKLEDSLRREQELREDLNKFIAIIANKPTTQNTTNNNNLNLSIFDKTPDDIKKLVDENYNLEYFIQGQKGVAKFTHKYVVNGEPNKPPIYVITDRSRGNGKYKLADGEIVTDIGMSGLTKKIHPSIKIKASAIASVNPDRMEECIDKYLEIASMDENNCIFRQTLVQEMTGE